MERRSFAARVGVVLVLAFAATVAVAPAIKPAVDLLVHVSDTVAHAVRFDSDAGTYDFGRVFRRLFMLTALCVVIGARRRLGHVPIMGIGRDAPRWRFLASGLGAGVFSWLVFTVTMVVVGHRGFGLEGGEGWLGGVAVALVAGLLVGMVEEWALRGYLLGGLGRQWPTPVAVLATSALYSFLHFLKAPVHVDAGFDPWVGAVALGEHFRALGEPGVPAGFLGLLLVGVVLSYAYLWTRSLWFAIGLHAGWVVMMQSERYYIDGPTGQRALYGEDGLLAAWPGWLFLLATLVLLFVATRGLRPGGES